MNCLNRYESPRVNRIFALLNVGSILLLWTLIMKSPQALNYRGQDPTCVSGNLAPSRPLRAHVGYYD